MMSSASGASDGAGADGAADSLILVAAGSSTRMGAGIKKEYLAMPGGGTVLSSAARAFLQAQPFAVVAVTYPAQKDDAADAAAREDCRRALFADPALSAAAGEGGTDFLFVSGGATRQQSVLYALEAVQDWYADRLDASDDADPLVFIHDGARPFVTSALVRATAEAAREYGAAVPGLQPVDTQDELDEHGRISRHLVRARLAAVQTPQVFRFFPLVQAHRTARMEQHECTDDTEIWDSYVAGTESADGTPYGAVKVIAGEVKNRKITFKSDIALFAQRSDAGGAGGGIGAESASGSSAAAHSGHDAASAAVASNADAERVSAAPAAARGFPLIRTGLGYDKHRLVAGRRLMLGGVHIPAEKGEDGHSDGDVLLHAITDAVLGAAALGDIGSYFPPEEAQWKDADSKALLARCWHDVTKSGWRLCNLDCVIVLETPKFLPHRDAVRASIAAVLGCNPAQVFVKAKTGEKLGDIGEGRAVEAWASCLLQKAE